MNSGKEAPLATSVVDGVFLPGDICHTREYLLPVDCAFYNEIARPDVKEKITQREPWLYVTAELYGEGIKGQGGLGMLASDTLEVAAKLGIYMDCLTIFYRKERSYEVGKNFEQKVKYIDVTPEERGFKDTGVDVILSTKKDPEVKFDVYLRKKGSVNVIAITEPNIGELYEDCPGSDRRLYQNVALGFGGYKAEKALGIKPSMNQQLNESPTVFSALARLDDHLLDEKDFNKALANVRQKTIYTNHSNVPAAEPQFTLGQFEHFVFPNIKNDKLKNWLRNKFYKNDGVVRLSSLAIDLSGKQNAVSRIHAKDASKLYKDCDGKEANFEAITNGIAIDRWGAKEFLDAYRENEILDVFDLPHLEKIDFMNEEIIRAIKNEKKEKLKSYLYDRKDQYGKPVTITKDAKIFDWRRRFADYKRPEMLFENPEILAFILDSENIDLVLAGNIHPTDDPMKKRLKGILEIIDKNPILKKRVHYIQDYDEALGKALSQGADVSINTPRVKENGKRVNFEACGTSWMKDILNLCILISTSDGGVADPEMQAEDEGRPFQPAYLQITGDTYNEEVLSLYKKILIASAMSDGKSNVSWGGFVKKQLKEYLPIISGSRMEKDYINLGFPIAKETIIYAM